MADPHKPAAPPRPRRALRWIAQARWAHLLWLGLAVFLAHRLLGIAVGMPAWISSVVAMAVAGGFAILKLATSGLSGLREEVLGTWQRLAEWLAVTGWGRLAAVGLLLFVSLGIANETLMGDDFEAVGLLVALGFGLAAFKVARGTRRTPLPGAAAPQPATPQPHSPRAAPAGDIRWIDRLTWPRLALVGVLLLLAAGVINHMAAPDRFPLIKIDTAQAPASDGASGPDTPPAPPAAPDAPAPPDAAPDTPAGAAASSPRGLTVDIGEHGVRIIENDAQGKVKEKVIIGPRGIVAEGKHIGDKVEITLPELEGLPGMTPDKAREIEERVREEIAAATEEAQDAQRGFDFASLAFLAIVSLAIMKILAGGKRRAEIDADRARVAADMARLEREAADAKLHAMQAQIEPHFLFNTLASVDQLIRTDPPRASQVQKTLIQYLRAAIPQMRDDAQRSTLGRQVQMCRAYLEIMQVRMEERLVFDIHAPEGLACAQFPTMMLQTLVENAIKHGLEPKPEGGRIEIAAEVARGKLRVKVADTGIGLAAPSHDGVGLSNIRERLRLLYGNTAALTLLPRDGGGAVALIEVPYIDDDGQTEKPC